MTDIDATSQNTTPQNTTSQISATTDLRRVARTTATLTIVSGVSALIFGILVLIWPKTTLLIVAVLFGLQLLISGIVRIVNGILDKSIEGWQRGLSITFGVLIVLAGILCLRNPALSLLTIIVIVAIGWLVDGIMNIVLGVQNPPGDRLGRILMGVVFLLGAIVLLVFPASALITFALLGGWILIIFGVVMLIAGILGIRAVHKIDSATPATPAPASG
jgi:uncharacterized membrane protein HdeD (DUF308 family)